MQSNSRASEATRFLDALFADALDTHPGLLVGTWNLATRRGACHSKVQDAVKRVLTADDSEQTVYFNTTLFHTRPQRGRGTEAEAGCLTALWVDIDAVAPHRHRPNLPPTKDAAVEFLEAAPLPPSIVVDSGYGVHAYWLLKEPWLIIGLAEREQARRYTTGWVGTLGGLAAQRGWHLDPVGDLARVLRVPGTSNRQADQAPVPVKIIVWEPERRYNPGDFDDLLPAEAPESHRITPDAPSATFDTAHDAVPPFDRFEALAANVPRFKRAWEHDRPDLQDQSPSGYDMSLASFAVAAEWTDAEIAALLVAFRRRHQLDPAKARRGDYLRNTIGRARATHETEAEENERRQAAADILRAARGIAAEPPADPTEAQAQRTRLLAEVSRAFGVAVEGWLQYGREPATATYSLRLAGGRVVPVGSVCDVLGWRAVRAALYVATGHVLRKFTDPQWSGVCRILASVVELVTDVEHSEMDTFRDWLDRYLSAQALNDDELTPEQRDNLIVQSHPFAEGGEVFVNVGHLRAFVKAVIGQQTSDRDLARYLRQLGYDSQRFHVRHGGHQSKPRYWHGPAPELDGDV